jgi:predicted PurR-regulated permease PerM
MTTPPVKQFDRLDYTYKLLICIAFVIGAVVLAREIVIPMAFAGLLSIVMLPAVRKMEKKIPTALAILIMILVSLIVMVGLFYLVINQVASLVSDLPNIQTQLDTYIRQFSDMLKKEYNISTSDQNKLISEAAGKLSTILGTIIMSTTGILSALVQIPIYIFLFLIYREKFSEFLRQMLGDDKLKWKNDVERVVQGYVTGLFLVTCIIATANTIGLLALGINHAIFFGVLSGVLTIIPYIGIFIGALLPVVMALITKDSIWYAVGVVIIFSLVQFAEGNFITPRITGSKVSINALAAIIALVIGSKILGLAGMILAIPAIGLIKILLSHSRVLHPFVILLEDADEKTLEKRKQASQLKLPFIRKKKAE